MGLIMRVSDQIVVMNFGKKLATGTPAQIQANEQVLEAYMESGMSTQEIPPLLALDEAVVGYGNLTALHGVSLHVQPGEVVAILGANGAGKSTTLRAISGLIRPTAGQITWKGQVISGRSPEHILKLGLAHCPEERHVWPEMTVEDNLDLGAYLIKSKSEERRKGIAFHRFPLFERAIPPTGGHA